MIADLLILSLSFLLGASFGSFFAATYLRLRSGQSLGGRSACPTCGAQIRARDNIPLFSWLWLRGQSSCCQQPISSFYFKVEGATAILALIVSALILFT